MNIHKGKIPYLKILHRQTDIHKYVNLIKCYKSLRCEIIYLNLIIVKSIVKCVKFGK